MFRHCRCLARTKPLPRWLCWWVTAAWPTRKQQIMIRWTFFSKRFHIFSVSWRILISTLEARWMSGLMTRSNRQFIQLNRNWIKKRCRCRECQVLLARTFSVGKLTTCWLQRSLFHSPLTRQTADIGWFLTNPDYGLWQHFPVLPARRFQILSLAVFTHHTGSVMKVPLDLKAIMFCRLHCVKAIRRSNQKCICPQTNDKEKKNYLKKFFR